MSDPTMTLISVMTHYAKHAMAELTPLADSPRSPVRTMGGEVQTFGPSSECDICVAVDFGAAFPNNRERIEVIDRMFTTLRSEAERRGITP